MHQIRGEGLCAWLFFVLGQGKAGCVVLCFFFFKIRISSSACHYVISDTRETSKEILGKQAAPDPQFPEPLKLFLDDGLLRVWFFVLSSLGRRSSGNSYTFSIFLYDSSGLLNILILR